MICDNWFIDNWFIDVYLNCRKVWKPIFTKNWTIGISPPPLNSEFTFHNLLFLHQIKKYKRHYLTILSLCLRIARRKKKSEFCDKKFQLPFTFFNAVAETGLHRKKTWIKVEMDLYLLNICFGSLLLITTHLNSKCKQKLDLVSADLIWLLLSVNLSLYTWRDCWTSQWMPCPPVLCSSVGLNSL